MTKRSNHRDRINGLDQARDRSAAKAAHTTVADEIAILEKLLAEKRAANQNASQLSENGIAETDGVLQPTEDAMYSWISPNPYQHYNRFKVWFRDLEGERKSKSFATVAEAEDWITDSQRLLVTDGRPIVNVVTAYLASLSDRKPSTLTTLRYRLMSVIGGRERVPIETFPWKQAWADHVAKQSRASQTGILGALRGLVVYAGLRGTPLGGLAVTGIRREGKEQLHIDEARRFVATALMAADSLALAAVTMAVTGCRPGEVLALRARDVDDGGAILHVYGTKTRAAKRSIPVDPAFQPVLLGVATGKAPDSLLFEFEPERVRPHQDEGKAKRDALSRRVRSLCAKAQVRRVVPHSLRGLNATLRLTGGATDDSITRALGHVDISTTRRSYFAPGAAELTEGRRAFGRLLPSADASCGNSGTSGKFPRSGSR
jgi:integrase